MTNYTQAQLRDLDTIGCDLGDKKSALFIIAPNDREQRPSPLATTRVAFSRFFAGRPKAHVVLEVGTHSRWVSALLEEAGHEVTIANPRNLKLISEGLRKSDRLDAELLTRMGRADVQLLSPIQHRGEQAQADLAIAKARDALVKSRARLVNVARGLVKPTGNRLPKCDTVGFHSVTSEHIPEKQKPALEPVYKVLKELAVQIKAMDKLVETVARTRYPDVEVVSQPQGVGVLTALVFILTIEDKTRFARSRDVGLYFGLCPRKRQSGNDDPQLRITKAGDPFVRRLLVQCANYILGPFGEDSELRRWGLELSARGGKAPKKRARVAVARKLAVLLHRLWVTGETYQPLGYRQAIQPTPTPA